MIFECLTMDSVLQEPPVEARQKPSSLAAGERRYASGWTAFLLVSDIVGFLISAYIAGALVDHSFTLADFKDRLLGSSYVFVAIWILIFQLLGMYRRTFALSIKDEFYYTVVALTLGIVPQFLLFTFLPALSTSRLVLVISVAFAIITVGGARAAAHAVRTAMERSRMRPVAVVVSDDISADIAKSFQRSDRDVVELRWALPYIQIEGNPQSADITSLDWFAAAVRAGCDTIILTKMLPPAMMPALLEASVRNHMRILFAIPGVSCHAFTLSVERFGDQALLSASQLRICTPSAQLIKRVVDVSFSLFALIMCAPIMALAALSVAVEAGGPVLFRQNRVGKSGKEFQVLKFRTMRPVADSSWARPGDARITKSGSILRRFSIDELAQFINVVRGEMSLVGPRPEMTSFAKTFAARLPRYNEPHLVAPGITGWAQVNFKRVLETDDVEQVLAYDLFYVEHWSLYMDVSIIFKTMVEFLFHRVA